ncbi:MAG: organomercurial lyase [Mycobacteriales bacterium]
MDDGDIAVRNVTYRRFVELGRAPTIEETAGAAGLSGDEVTRAWVRLHEAHALVLASNATEIRMANPFSAVTTAHRVFAADRWWFANCAWDAFGICAALDVDGRIETSCPDCSEPIALDVRDKRSDDESLVFLCPLPAARWWDDIGFT